MRTHLTLTTGRYGLCLIAIVCVFLLTLGFACAPGGEESEQEEAEETAAEEAAEGEATEAEASEGAPRVWFISPEDGASVQSPVHIEIGAENITIEPKGDIHAGAGHHHVGVDTECLPPGTPIPEADPWVHLGDGSNTMDMQLTPGEHTLTAQLGDGEHVTLDEPRLCTTIKVTVTE